MNECLTVAQIRDFESIQPGDTAVFTRVITEGDVDGFAGLSGDQNPLHMDSEFASKTHLRKRVVHGMLVASFVSTMIGMELPGAGSLWIEQSFRWRNPVYIGDRIQFTLRVTHKSVGSRILSLEITAMNQNGKTVMDGEGAVSMPETRKAGSEIPIEERLAFVSGASRGIGAATARALAAAGATVIVNYRTSAAEAEEVCHGIAATGGTALPMSADVTDPEAVAAAVASAAGRFGKVVDVLVNCAGGVVRPKAFAETSWEDVQQAFDLHLKGSFYCAKAVIPGMLQQKSGRIVNIGSILTWNVPPVHWTAFVMAKAALRAMTRSMAAELGPGGIRVNMISPGTTETSDAEISERLRKLQAMQTPLRRLAQVEDVARTAVFLCGEASQFITGADIPVSGGAGM
jgi:3-oxoacyl-[acyl-carrier protein] reductase